VVYWVGCLDDLQCPQDVYVNDISVMDIKLEKTEEWGERSPHPPVVVPSLRNGRLAHLFIAHFAGFS
jgi:hypothetical protein